MKNQAFLRFELCGRERTIHTNEVELRPFEIEFEKFAPECNHVIPGERVEFRIKLKNRSHKDLHNVIFTDPLPRELRFIPNSFRVNGHHEHAQFRRNEIEFKFEHFPAGKEFIITFDVRVEERRRHERECHCEPERRPREMQEETEIEVIKI